MAESGDQANEIGELGPPEYLVFRVLSERDNQDNFETSRTRIHKLCCLADRRLHEEYGRSIGLPKYWFRYGRTIDESLINSAVSYTPNAKYFSGQAYYPADQVSESDFDHLPEELKDDIYYAVWDTVDEHGEKDAKELEEYQYKNYAPNEFVRAYGDYRWFLSHLSIHSSQETLAKFVPPRGKSKIEEMLDDMLIAFDEERYADIYDLYLDWDDTSRILNEIGASPREILDFTETFIEAFAKAELRFEENENIPESRIQEWEEEYHEVKKDLRGKIKRKRHAALMSEERNESQELNRISDSYNESISEELEDL